MGKELQNEAQPRELRISGRSSVIAIVCSKWAASELLWDGFIVQI